MAFEPPASIPLCTIHTTMDGARPLHLLLDDRHSYAEMRADVSEPASVALRRLRTC